MYVQALHLLSTSVREMQDTLFTTPDKAENLSELQTHLDAALDAYALQRL